MRSRLVTGADRAGKVQGVADREAGRTGAAEPAH